MEFKRVVILFLILVTGVASLPTDETDRLRTFGKDVVDSVNFLIKSSEIFPEDYRFLLRVAHIETLYGTQPHTFRPFYYGGIWQINETIFDSTKAVSTYPNLTSYYQQIRDEFSIDWSSSLVTWSDLHHAIRSALAFRLYFSAVNQLPIPDTIARQAEFWQTYFNQSGSTEVFINEIKRLETELEERVCEGAKIKFAIVLDGSGSVGASDFRRATSFAVNLISMFNVNNTKISFIVYSDSANVIVPLNHNMTMAQLNATVSSTPFPAGGTNTHLGINAGISQLNVNEEDLELGIPHLMLVLTDGLSNNRPATIESANRAHALGIKSFSIGIGTGIDASELLAIAGNESSRVLSLTSFDALVELPYHLSSEMCNIPQNVSLCVTVTDTVSLNEARYFSFSVPTEGLSIDLHVVSGGAITGYYAYNSFPNPALNAGRITEGWNLIRYDSSVSNQITLLMRGPASGSNKTYTLKAYKGLSDSSCNDN